MYRQTDGRTDGRINKNLILSSDASRQNASNGVRVAYVNFDDKWSYDTVKDDVEVTTNTRVYVLVPVLATSPY